MRKSKWLNDEDVLAEGRKYASRSEFSRNSCSAYRAALARGLLDQLYKRGSWNNDEDVLAEGRKYASRSEFWRGSCAAYSAALERDLLDQLYPRQRVDWSNDEDVLAEGRKYASRSEFASSSRAAYQVAWRRGLLDQLYPASKWSNDEDLFAEGRKYASRGEFGRKNPSAYDTARRRNLLDLIDWLEENAPSDNDAIYIWRAVGQHYNGNPVYKIGVTSARLGTERIAFVANKSGFEFDLICCEPVACKATDLEAKLLIIGEDPGYTGFNGATEFRALSDSALYAAVSLICNQL